MVASTSPAANPSARINIGEIKTIASGRWPEILEQLGGVDRAVLDGRHHPCPKCGGTDRFRLVDEDAGALLCNQCFNQQNGDGLAAIEWLTGWSFPEVCRRLAEYLDINGGGNGAQPKAAFGEKAQAKRGRPFNCKRAAIAEVQRWALEDGLVEPLEVIEHNYEHADGELSFIQVRFNSGEVDEATSKRKKCVRPIHNYDGSWYIGTPPEDRRPLYNLPAVAAAIQRGETVTIVEGEKATDALAAIGIVATTVAFGKGGAKKTDLSPLAGAAVAYSPDADAPEYAATIAEQLAKLNSKPARPAKLITLEGVGEKGDAADYLELPAFDSWEPERIKQHWLEMIEAAPEFRPDDHGSAGDDDDGEERGQRQKTQKDILIGIALAADLFHNPDGDPYATIRVGDHVETHPVRSRGFRRWLSQQYFDQTDNGPSSQAVQDALIVVEGKACFAGPQLPVDLRLAEHDGDIYLDLANDRWEVVKVTPAGWSIEARSPVRFRRPKAMLALPRPEAGGSIDQLRHFINVDDDHFTLITGWLAAAMRPRGPYPVICLHAEQGSGKSTTARVLREMVDPNGAALRSEPRQPHDLAIAGNNSWIICLDNLSDLRVWLSDCICRLATGGGFATRALYTDDEESIFSAQRPVILNGIDDLAVRGDLLDRAVIVNLPRINEPSRRTEELFWRQFNEAKPYILGALLDAVSVGLRRLPDVRLERLPRMADFAVWATACEPGLGLAEGAFLEQYTANRSSANELVLEASPASAALTEFMSRRPEWEGTATDLLAELNCRADEATQHKRERDKSWPKSARSLTNALRRLAPNLRATGLDVEFVRQHGGNRRRLISISKKEV